MRVQLDSFENYADFVDYMECVASSYHGNLNHIQQKKRSEIEALLNGANAKAVSKFLSNSHRKKNGIFFTGEVLAKKVAQRIKGELQAGKRVYDPACGSADLLLACTNFLPIKSTLGKTIKSWSDVLSGTDLFEDFVRSAKSRLFLAAVSRLDFPAYKSKNLAKNFDHIQKADFFDHLDHLKKVDCIVTNPPFGNTDLTGRVSWSSGAGQLAAVFIDKLIAGSKNGTHIVAILPDVLRSGTRYQKWRKLVNNNSSFVQTELCGKFDNEADVDVFILDFIVHKNYNQEENTSFEGPVENYDKVLDDFKISIGSVVPHRVDSRGPWVAFADARNSKIWQENVPSERIRFRGTLVEPPFVVLRRTSGPDDRLRLNSAIITGEKLVAVENHLIVLKPKDNSLTKCQQFQEYARTEIANNWINSKIRCRHLTVGVLGDLPWKASDE